VPEELPAPAPLPEPKAAQARTSDPEALGTSVPDWLRVRDHLRRHRPELCLRAAEGFPRDQRLAGTPLLTRPEWLAATPVPLDGVHLTWTDRPHPMDADAEPRRRLAGHAAGVCPREPDGSSPGSYSAAMAAFARPTVFCDRSTYRLRSARLTPVAELEFGPGSYFDGIEVGEACAHEFTARQLGLLRHTPLREAIGDPCDLSTRPANLAVATLTLRHDRRAGTASFPLHWRAPGAVGHAGGTYMVMPVGVFQASGDEPWHREHDFSLWRCLVREFAEELLGEPEDRPTDSPLDYDRWPAGAALQEGRIRGTVRARVLGLGVDPLTLATDLLTVLTVDSDWWDEQVGPLADTNAEGLLVRSPDGLHAFTDTNVQELTDRLPFQAAGAALLRLAWTHRDALLEA